MGDINFVPIVFVALVLVVIFQSIKVLKSTYDFKEIKECISSVLFHSA